MNYISDVRLYHDMKEQARKMVELFAFHETNEYQACVSYHYDNEACEESCSCTRINRLGKDFNAEEECWQCIYYCPNK